MKKHIVYIVLITLFYFPETDAATVYVPGHGSSGPQTFSYDFTSDFSGEVVIGVSDEGDFELPSHLDLPSYSIFLSTNGPSVQDTSAYLNTLGEAGTDGELYIFDYTATAGDELTFDWEFSTADYSPFNDFAFINIQDLHYEVLAQITAIPLPAAVWLFGTGLLGLFGIRRRQSQTA